jgi:hypothetical protein
MYSDIYESLQTTKINHDELHNICLRICDALNDYNMIINKTKLPTVFSGNKLGYPVARKVS